MRQTRRKLQRLSGVRSDRRLHRAFADKATPQTAVVAHSRGQLGTFDDRPGRGAPIRSPDEDTSGRAPMRPSKPGQPEHTTILDCQLAGRPVVSRSLGLMSSAIC